MTDRLPLEVYRRIVDHLQPITDNTTLISLAQTSRVLQPIAEQVLYHILYLVGPQAVSSILASFVSRPALVPYSRQVFIYPNERRTSHAYWTEVIQFLAHVGPHLELVCISSQDPDTPYATWVLQGLHEAVGLNVLRVPFWWCDDVVDFLRSDGARSLTRLETGDTHPLIVGVGEEQLSTQLTLRPEAAPNLNVVDAPPNALCQLVPGRPVTHVKLRLGPPTVSQTLPSPELLVGEYLVRSTAPSGVIALDIGDLTYSHHGETYSLEVMELAPRFLPHLRFMGKVNFPWTKDALPSRMYKTLIQLPELDTLELVVTHMHPSVDVYWEIATTWELRTYNTSLRQIVFFNGPEMHRWVWSARETDFVLVSHNERYHLWGGV